MKDFRLRNDTVLLFRNDPTADLASLTTGKRVLFVYGGSSARSNGCYDDVKSAVAAGKGEFFELANASRELADIERGLELVNQHQIEIIIGAGGASIMDCSKLIAFGTFHQADLWDYIKGRKNPYGEAKLPLILMPTYPSSGSEYGLGAVSADKRTGDYGTAFGIPADTAILVPKYSLSLNAEMTAYTGLVTLVQLSAGVIGDKNPVTYDAGVSVIKNVLKATQRLQEEPGDLEARGIILFGASISTSGRLGIGKAENYAYDIYEVEFAPEMLFGVPYRKSLTTIFPGFLQVLSKYHQDEVQKYLHDVFELDGDIAEATGQLRDLFGQLGVDMYFDGELPEKSSFACGDTGCCLTKDDCYELLQECMRK